MKKLTLILLLSTLSFVSFAQFVNVTQEALGSAPAQVQGKESISWPDVNNDGWPDLFVDSKYLYINQQDGTFLLQDPAENGFDQNYGISFSRTTFADADNDGDLDCILTAYYGNKTIYFENSGAPDFHFTASDLFTHEPNVCGGQPTFFDSDGDLEYEAYLGMVGNWDPYNIGRDRFFDRIDGVWADVTAERMPQLETPSYKRPTRGTVACDYDNDKDIDMFVTVYGISTTESHDNILWQNDGEGNFTDVATAAGVAVEPNSGYEGLASGASWGDFNNDGYFDLAVANIHGIAALYQNNQDGTFTNEGFGLGLPNWAFEWHNTLFLDYDNDGDMDLFLNQWYNGKTALLFRNDGPENLGHFTEVTYFLGFTPSSDLNYITGWAFADYDMDGDLDLAFYNNSDNYRGTYIWRNDQNEGNHWLIAKLIGNGTTVNQNAIGARARIMFDDDTWSPIKQVESTSADQGMNMHPLHFGLGTHETYTYIKVEWPDGTEEYFLPGQFSPGVDAHINLEQGSGYLTPVEQREANLNISVIKKGQMLTIRSDEQITNIQFIDMAGRQLYPTIIEQNLNSVSYNVSNLHGVYIIKGSCFDKTFTRKAML